MNVIENRLKLEKFLKKSYKFQEMIMGSYILNNFHCIDSIKVKGRKINHYKINHQYDKTRKIYIYDNNSLIKPKIEGIYIMKFPTIKILTTSGSFWATFEIKYSSKRNRQVNFEINKERFFNDIKIIERKIKLDKIQEIYE